MADLLQVTQRLQQRPADVFKSIQEKGSLSSTILAVVTLLPLGGFLLLLSGLTLAGTLVGMAVVTPLFVIFSPVLVPAAITIGLAITGCIASGAFGFSALSAFCRMVNYLPQIRLPEQIEHAKQMAQEATGLLTHSVHETGLAILSKAQDAVGRTQSKAHDTAGKAQDAARE